MKPRRPPTFRNTQFKPVANPVNHEDIAECQKCVADNPLAPPEDNMNVIDNTEFQFCQMCTKKQQYKGEGACWCCGRLADGEKVFSFNAEEAILVCNNCSQKKHNRNLPSYKFLKETVYTVKECPICNNPVIWHRGDGKVRPDTACIDHKHYKDLSPADQHNYGKKGKLRGVLCCNCNFTERKITKYNDCPLEWAKSLVKYLENPPMDGMNLQVSNP
jgi:hypothetical protein